METTQSSELFRRWQDEQRYFHVYMPYHQNRSPRGFVSEHRLIVEIFLGGPIPEGAHVHHRDQNPANNAFENLLLMPGMLHDALHSALRRNDARAVEEAEKWCRKHMTELREFYRRVHDDLPKPWAIRRPAPESPAVKSEPPAIAAPDPMEEAERLLRLLMDDRSGIGIIGPEATVANPPYEGRPEPVTQSDDDHDEPANRLAEQRDLYLRAREQLAAGITNDAPAALAEADDCAQDCLEIDASSAWGRRAAALLPEIERAQARVFARVGAMKSPPTCRRHERPVEMVLRDGPTGSFWGCPNFPSCKHTRPFRVPKPG